MADILNDDDLRATVTLPDGRVVKNLTPEEYAATYADGSVHGADIEESDVRGNQE